MGWKDAPLKVAPKAAARWASAPLKNAKDERGVLARAASNTPASAKQFATSIYEAVRHPIKTGMAVLDVAAGGLQKGVEAVAPGVVRALDSPNAARARDSAGAVGGYFKDRYGGLENIKETFATDPVGFAADAATVLTGGGAAVAKVPQLAKAGGAISKVGAAVDPINLAGKAAAYPLKVAGRRTADVVGGLGTHTGGESVRQAFTSGMEGGEKAKAFRENMRGNVPPSEVVDQARQAVATLRSERGQAYRAGMADVSKDQTVLDMQPVIDELNDQAAKGQYKGQTIDPSTADVKQQVSDAVVEWWRLDPKEFHTPEGLDALKKKIGDIRESTQPGTAARTVADGVYNSVKATITKQAPGYAKVMKDYENASDALREVQRALSLGDKASADTALRKLQSLLRNNANANYGGRVEAAKKIGADKLMPALAGQSLNTWTPRGLGLAQAGVVGGIGGMTLNPLAIPMLAAQSPRLVGELAHAAGRGINALARPAGAARPVGLTAYEADQINRGTQFSRNALAR